MGFPSDEPRMQSAFAEGRAAALRGEEAAPGCTATEEGRAWLRGYVEGARERGLTARA